jgi:hypothetical protein
MHADPDYQARRRAGLDAYFAQPGIRALHGARLRAGYVAFAANNPAERERRREHGRWLVREVLTPERVARSQSPEARAKAIAGYVETVMGWCPPALRPDYHRLVRQNIPAAEARRIIEADIPGTIEHARREIANRELAARLRHERAAREAY